MRDAQDALRGLLGARAVRERAKEIFVYCAEGRSDFWSLDLERLPQTEAFVLEVTAKAYPDLAPPFHSRWRHFEINGEDRGAPYRATPQDPAARARRAFDLAIVSVLLDAGSGVAWRYRTAKHGTLARSEGLAIASLDMFEAGLFSSSAGEPRRVDAEALEALSLDALAAAFQAGPENPIAGLPGRLTLLHRLAQALRSRPDLFGTQGAPRPGALFDRLRARGAEKLRAEDVLSLLLDAFGPIWPSGLWVEGLALGDVWRHPAIRRADSSDGLAPFHKLSQWMAYSLIEPLQWSGVAVTEIDGLTGLPEYRNGGLLVDFDVLKLRDPALAEQTWEPADPLVVEWRALTVHLLDRLAEGLRRRLRTDAQAWPLARILQGGTWSAGREIARERRPDAKPPLVIASDGTVF